MEDKFTPYFNGPSIKQILIFELSSFFGRKFKRKRSKITSNNNPLLVDIGVGSNYTQGWLHVDFFKFPKLKFWKKSLKIRPDVETDLRFPLNCAENIVDGIYCGHTIEHLYPKAAYQLLNEMFRVLQPGCWLRINFPDLGKYIDYYNRNQSHFNFSIYKTGCEAISDITQNYGHHSVWDKEFMEKTLKSVGFINIRQWLLDLKDRIKDLLKRKKSENGKHL